MIGFTRKFRARHGDRLLLIAAIGGAHAAGAFAVGACGAYGYGYDYRKPADARAAAMKQCSGNACKIIGEIRQRLCCARDRCQASVRIVRLGGQFTPRQSRERVAPPLL